MENDKELIQLELKYCERCGGLWFRLRDSSDVYCGMCAIAMSEVAVGARSRRHPRLPVGNVQSECFAEDTAWMEGGTA